MFEFKLDELELEELVLDLEDLVLELEELVLACVGGDDDNDVDSGENITVGLISVLERWRDLIMNDDNIRHTYINISDN